MFIELETLLYRPLPFYIYSTKVGWDRIQNGKLVISPFDQPFSKDMQSTVETNFELVCINLTTDASKGSKNIGKSSTLCD